MSAVSLTHLPDNEETETRAAVQRVMQVSTIWPQARFGRRITRPALIITYIKKYEAFGWFCFSKRLMITFALEELGLGDVWATGGLPLAFEPGS